MYYLHAEEMKQIIEENLINPSIVVDIETLLKAREKWRITANTTETVGHVLMAASTVLAFASGVFKNEYLSFTAGCVNIISLTLLNFSYFAEKESKKRNDSLNGILSRVQNMPRVNNFSHNIPVNSPVDTRSQFI